MRIQPVTDDDIDAWLVLRCALRPEVALERHHTELGAILANRHRHEALLCWSDEAGPVGLVEVSRRTELPGCDLSPVGCLEAVFVKPARRGEGFARDMIEAAESWARRAGCQAIVSIVEADDSEGHELHAAFGFAEIRRTVMFHKTIDASAEQLFEQRSDGVSAGDVIANSDATVAKPSAGFVWWPVHAVIALLGAFAIASSDLSSPDLMAGAGYPALGAGCVIYIGVLLAVKRYRQRTDERNRGEALFTGRLDD